MSHSIWHFYVIFTLGYLLLIYPSSTILVSANSSEKWELLAWRVAEVWPRTTARHYQHPDHGQTPAFSTLWFSSCTGGCIQMIITAGVRVVCGPLHATSPQAILSYLARFWYCICSTISFTMFVMYFIFLQFTVFVVWATYVLFCDLCLWLA